MDNPSTGVEEIVNVFVREYNKTLEGLASGEPINEDEFFENNDV